MSETAEVARLREMVPWSDDVCALMADFLNTTRYEKWWPDQVREAFLFGQLSDMRLREAALKWKQAQIDGYHTRQTVYDADGNIVGFVRVPVSEDDIEREGQ